MWITDSLSAAISSVRSRWGRDASPATQAFGSQLAIGAYLTSGLLKKVIAIPAADRTSKWRDWQAEADDIELIEKEEKRLSLRAKVKQAEILRGIGGGALVLIAEAGGNHNQPLNAAQIRQGGLVAVNVLSRWQLSVAEWDKDFASPTFGEPLMWRVNSGTANAQDIHPSRVIAFRGDPLSGLQALADDQAYWGDCRLDRVWREVQNADNTQAWFAALVRKAKLLRFGIPGLSEQLAAPGGQERIAARVATIAEGENILNATVYEAAAGTDRPGEAVTDYQVTWAGIPAVMDAFDQRVAAVADIPFTRLMGRSPAGMNATGQHDTDNWWAAVSDGQENELRPCMEQLDPFLLASAGVTATDVTWKWADLSTPTEAETAATFKTEMEAVTLLQATNAIPQEAFNKGVQNLMSEREYMPGLDGALAELPEDERFGIIGTMDPSLGDPSALDPQQQQGGDPASGRAGGTGGSGPAARS
ncbi:phage-related protein (TIGR01555 family) [Sphingomonas trueperi]|uniref:phage portal protein n=1 Tax=Sphingomonas trueperi TaxID=53317 RepID=UPI0033961605